MIHIRHSKGKKNRYVLMGKVLSEGIKKFLDAEHPSKWLFNGNGDPGIEGHKGGDFDSRNSQRGVQWAVTAAVKQAGINKDVSVHTLHHTYATHLLEEGMYIRSIQKLFGHESIDTTMIYLHVAKPSERPPLRPLDRLYGK